MALVFQDDIHFDGATDTAIIWGDDGGKRFRLMIPRKVLVDQFGLEKYFDHASAKTIIRSNMARFEQVAQAAHDVGKSEVIIE